MFLSTFSEREEDSGNYFSYPQATNRLQKNIQVCLPRGFTSSGPEYQMYKDNCMDLMADECSVEWGPLCNAYNSNLNKNEQELFKQYVDERSTPHALAPNNSCTKQQSSVVPEQVDIRGINPYVDQKTGIALPLSCPSKVNGSIQTAEFVGQQVYLHDQQKNRSSAPSFYQTDTQPKTTPIPFVPRPTTGDAPAQTPIPFVPRPTTGATPDQTPIPFWPNPTAAPMSAQTPIPFYPVPTQGEKSVEVQVAQPVLLPLTHEVKEEKKEAPVTPIPFMPGQGIPPVLSATQAVPDVPVFMPEQLNNPQKKVSFALPSSPVSMFVTDEAAINDLIYGSDSSDCAAKTACSISKIMG
jgi:hypothetical protein